MWSKIFICGLLIISATGCGGIKMLSSEERRELYRDSFFDEIQSIKRDYRAGNTQKALHRLKNMQDAESTPAELALKHNLLGVLYFAQKNYEKAISNFKLADTFETPDTALMSQIALNLASSYFKLKLNTEAVAALGKINKEFLGPDDRKKFHHLSFVLYSEVGDSRAAILNLIEYLGTVDSLAELRQNVLMERLSQDFFKLSNDEQIRILEEFSDELYTVVGYLGFLQAERLYYSGDKEASSDLIDWLKGKFESNEEFMEIVSNFSYRMENFSKINPMAIGVILPFSASKKGVYAKRAMLGIDSSFRKSLSALPKDSKPVLHIRDSAGSGVVGANVVKELVEKNYVSAIIGGLFPKEATKEYLMAKKYGVLYISLSQIYLPREEKSHLLVEIPGSVESLVSKLFSDEMIQNFGNRAAIFYPNSQRGKAYVDEFWRQAKLKNLDVRGVQRFEVKQNDYRDPVRKLLGLKFTRERKEELELLNQIHSLQKKSSIRRVQTLPPLIDFDWIFMPAHPNEALQLIPSFTYFDAFNLRFIGGPSWRSKSLSDRSRKLGTIYFLGDDLDRNQSQFRDYFYSMHAKYPKLIETLSYDGMKILMNILSVRKFASRDELEMQVLNKSRVEGITGSWNFAKGLWLKEMTPLLLKKGQVEKLFSSVEAVESTEATVVKKQ